MKLLLLLTAAATTAAFAPPVSIKARSANLRSTENEQEAEIDQDAETFAILSDPSPSTVSTGGDASVVALNGWIADPSLPCYGLPGALAPTGFFDPLGFAQKGITLNEVKRNREAEVMHGRVAMIACVGYIAGEAVSGPFSINGPANDQLQQMPAPAFALLTIAIGAAELKRATIGWVEPDLGSWTKTLWKLRENYYPGDVGFDPLGLKPDDPKAFADIQTKEIQNGRLAMLGVAGMCAQELVNHRTIGETLNFYQQIYSGTNPYEGCGDSVIC